MVFFGPHSWSIPALFAAEFFLFLNTGPLNAAIVNSVSAPVRATAISFNLFCIHFFGDTFSPQIIGAISDRSNLSIGLGATLIFLVISCVILWNGARFAPPLEEAVVEGTSVIEEIADEVLALLEETAEAEQPPVDDGRD
jgi:hypothetical protein